MTTADMDLGVVKSGEREDSPEPGLYVALLESITPGEAGCEPWAHKSPADQLKPRWICKWKLLRYADDGSAVEGPDAMTEYLTRSLNTNSNFYNRARALLGGTLPEGTRVSAAQLIGQQCILTIEQNNGGYAQIKGATPIRRRQPAPATPPEDLGAVTGKEPQPENAHLPPAPKGTVNQTEYD